MRKKRCTFYCFTKHGLDTHRSMVRKKLLVVVHWHRKEKEESSIHKQGREILKLDRATANHVKQFPSRSDFASFGKEEPLKEKNGIYSIPVEGMKDNVVVSCTKRQAMLQNSEDNTKKNKNESFFGSEKQSIVDESQRVSVGTSIEHYVGVFSNYANLYHRKIENASISFYFQM